MKDLFLIGGISSFYAYKNTDKKVKYEKGIKILRHLR